MKKIFKIATLFSIIFLNNSFVAQEDKTVELTTTGTGKTKEIAIHTALRSAIEQAFGAFISSKTEILNDNLISDQITSVSSGNIKNYEVLNEGQLPNGLWGLTLKTIVSIDKLTSFVQAKGINVEVKGGLFALNIKQQLLNEQGEIEAVSIMLGSLHEPMQTAFDYELKTGEPKSLDLESKTWIIPLEVTVKANKNEDICQSYFRKTLRSLSMSEAEVDSYKSLGKKFYRVDVKFNGFSREYFYLRKEKTMIAIYAFISNWDFYKKNFQLKSNISIPEMKFNTAQFGGHPNNQWEIVDLKKERNQKEYKIQDYDLIGGYSFDKSKNWACNQILSNPNPAYSKKGFANVGYVEINFPLLNNLCEIYKINLELSLTQIETLNGFSVSPIGIVSKFKNGGYVVYEKDGHGFVINIYDNGYNFCDGDDPRKANSICKELHALGYQDWRLPTVSELKAIHKNIALKGIGNLNWNKGYLSSTKDKNGNTANYNFGHEESVDFYYPYYGLIRAVRSF
jgi:hypothetical protein